jgi:hypothetical protein
VDGRRLTTAESAEIELFEIQDRLRVEREEREEAFEEKMRLQRQAFENSERKRRNDIIYQFAHQLWVRFVPHDSASTWKTNLVYQDEGIDEMRKHAVPAYTFTKFSDLPPEFQLRIWSLAARTEEPQIHLVVAMTDDRSQSEWNSSPYCSYGVEGSSRINRDVSIWDPKPVPTVLHISSDSRMVAQTVYTRLLFSDRSDVPTGQEGYFNTLYDSFYFGHKIWTDFKILVDTLLTLNTTRPLHSSVKRDLKRFQNVRFFIVDFNIFAGAPSRLWAEFHKLEKLTIAIYPYERISNPEATPDAVSPAFIKPHRGSYHGKRADWLHQAALDSLQAAKDHDVPQWKIPEIEVVVRRTGNDEIYDTVMEEWADEDMSEMEGDIEKFKDDSVWYEQATKVLAQTVSPAEVKRLKSKFLPSRQVRISDPACWKKE